MKRPDYFTVQEMKLFAVVGGSLGIVGDAYLYLSDPNNLPHILVAIGIPVGLSLIGAGLAYIHGRLDQPPPHAMQKAKGIFKKK